MPFISASGDDSRSGSECSEQDTLLASWRGVATEEGVAAQLTTPPPQLELRPQGGVWVRASIPSGTRFGPFLGKWAPEPQDEDYSWEVGK